ncbi:20964_t:CDS:1, partial [Racocetra persica]
SLEDMLKVKEEELSKQAEMIEQLKQMLLDSQLLKVKEEELSKQAEMTEQLKQMLLDSQFKKRTIIHKILERIK